MSNINELKDALKDTLESRGKLNEIRAIGSTAVTQHLY